MGAGWSSGDDNGSDQQLNLDPLSAVVRGYDVHVPEDARSVSNRVRGELSLLFVLKDPHLHRLFEGWLAEHSAESLLKFWVECDDYNRSASGRSVRFLHVRASEIYQRYLEPESPPNSLELDAETREEIARVLWPRGNGGKSTALFKLLRSGGLITIFQSALRKTFHTLLFDYLPDFFASKTEEIQEAVDIFGPGLSMIRSSLGEGQGGREGGGSAARVGGGSGLSDGSTGDSKPRPFSMLKVAAAESAFLEHPRATSGVGRYLAGVEAGGRDGGGGGFGGHENDVDRRCLDCLESLRECQKADTVERRQELWTAIQRRYCREAGVSVAVLDALSSCAAAANAAAAAAPAVAEHERHLGGEQQLYPATGVLEEAFDEVADIFMTRYLSRYQAFGRFSGSNNAKGDGPANEHGRRRPSRDPTAAQAAAQKATRRRASYQLQEPLRCGGNGNSGLIPLPTASVDCFGGDGGSDTNAPDRMEYSGQQPCEKGPLRSSRRRLKPLLPRSPPPLARGLSADNAVALAFTIGGGGGVGRYVGGRDSSGGRYNGDEARQVLSQRRIFLGTPEHGVSGNHDQPDDFDEEDAERRVRSPSDSVLEMRKLQQGGKFRRSADLHHRYSRCYGGNSPGGAASEGAHNSNGRPGSEEQIKRSNSGDFEGRGGAGKRERNAQAGLSTPGRSSRASARAWDRSASGDAEPCESVELVDLNTLLKDKLGLRLFRRHSKEHYQEENVALWKEIANFRNGHYAAPPMGRALEVGEDDSIASIRARRARLIYDTHISESAGSQVNLSARIRETALRNIESLERAVEASDGEGGSGSIVLRELDHCNIFDDIQREVFQLMETNLWTSFKRSNRYDFFASKYWSHHARRSGHSDLPATVVAAARKDRLLPAAMRLSPRGEKSTVAGGDSGDDSTLLPGGGTQQHRASGGGGMNNSAESREGADVAADAAAAAAATSASTPTGSNASSADVMGNSDSKNNSNSNHHSRKRSWNSKRSQETTLVKLSGRNSLVGEVVTGWKSFVQRVQVSRGVLPLRRNERLGKP